MRIKRAEKYGFCAGVRIADRKVKKFAAAGGRGAILGQVVHNERVVREMEDLGVRTVDGLDEVTSGTIVFSAHGVPPSFLHTARRRGLQVLDTTCPFVYDVHDDAQAALAQGLHLAFIGDPRHREIIGYTHDLDPAAFHVVSTVEEAQAVDWSRYTGVRILYQTTLNAEEYEAVASAIEAGGANESRESETSGDVVERAPVGGRPRNNVSRTDTICYATKENQEAALLLAQDAEVEAILVIGGKNSANTRHLWEICARVKPSYLVHGPEDLQAEWLDGVEVLGVTAGASTPDYLIDEVEGAAQAMRTAAAVGAR